MSAIAPPYPPFSDRDGAPLEAGYIWIGVENLNAITDPVAVYWDAALTQPAAQPIRTQGGYPVNNGTPARLYTQAAYSILVQDRNGVTVYNSASGNTDINVILGVSQWLTVTGTDALVGSSPISAGSYAAGQTFRFTSAGANTGAVTLNVNGLGVKSVTKNGATALAAGDIPASAVVTVTYDGARFQLSSIASAVEFVSRQTVGAVSAIDFTIPSGYTDFEVSWSLSFSVDAQLLLRSSVDGTTFPSGASDYSTAYIFNSGASGSNIASNASGSIIASPVADAASAGTGSFRLHTANGFRVQGATSLILNAAGAQWEQGVAAGVRNVGTVPLAFRILPSSGTVTGTVTLRGLR
jgi:hypothetical protein